MLDTQCMSLAQKGNIFGMNETLIPITPHKSPRRREIETRKLTLQEGPSKPQSW